MSFERENTLLLINFSSKYAFFTEKVNQLESLEESFKNWFTREEAIAICSMEGIPIGHRELCEDPRLKIKYSARANLAYDILDSSKEMFKTNYTGIEKIRHIWNTSEKSNTRLIDEEYTWKIENSIEEFNKFIIDCESTNDPIVIAEIIRRILNTDHFSGHIKRMVLLYIPFILNKCFKYSTKYIDIASIIYKSHDLFQESVEDEDKWIEYFFNSLSLSLDKNIETITKMKILKNQIIKDIEKISKSSKILQIIDIIIGQPIIGLPELSKKLETTYQGASFLINRFIEKKIIILSGFDREKNRKIIFEKGLDL